MRSIPGSPTHARLLAIAVVAFVASQASRGIAQTEVSADDAPPGVSISRVVSLPGGSLFGATSSGGTSRGELFIKPGHWTSAWVEAVSTDANVRGSLTADWVDDAGAMQTFPPSGYRLRHERPIVLPKGQRRGSEQMVFVPCDEDSVGPRVGDWRESRLREAGGRFRIVDDGKFGEVRFGGAMFGNDPELRQRAVVLRHHQALFVVLAEKPSDYAFLGAFDALASPHSPRIPAEHEAHYRTVFAVDGERALLPSSLLGYTTTAAMLWDGFDLARLSDDQRQALVDWVHWGGVLIIGGPGTLDSPSCEPLAEWLPARADGARELDAAALASLVAATIDGPPPDTARSWPGVRLVPHADAVVLLGNSDAPLVVERRLGRGRIVATAFRPAQAQLAAWPSYAGLFNTHLLRRPPRYWRPHPADQKFVAAVWQDRANLPTVAESQRGEPDAWFDASRVSAVRLLGRGDTWRITQPPQLDLQPAVASGPAGWRDDVPLIETAADVLREASGIYVPPASLVLTLLAGYIAAAVPANWLVFRLLGRTEWAWLMTPVLAGIFTVVVVRAAELDLGFVRSVSETAVVELQPNYDRAHVSRFVSFYNSLGTGYSVTGDDPSFVALPFSAVQGRNATGGDGEYALVRRSTDEADAAPTLEGFVVESGNVGFIRTEQMTSLGGSLQAEPLDDDRVRITNGTAWDLHDVRLTGRGRATMDLLPAGATIDVELQTAIKETTTDDAATEGAARRESVNVEPLWRKLQADAAPDELRLTAWSPQAVPGLVITPLPSQRRHKTVVVAVLQQAPDPPLRLDTNTRAAVMKRVGAEN